MDAQGTLVIVMIHLKKNPENYSILTKQLYFNRNRFFNHWFSNPGNTQTSCMPHQLPHFMPLSQSNLCVLLSISKSVSEVHTHRRQTKMRYNSWKSSKKKRVDSDRIFSIKSGQTLYMSILSPGSSKTLFFIYFQTVTIIKKLK